MTTIGPAEVPRGGPLRIGPYEVRERLGEGGMGIVYAAEQTNPARRVALKVMRAALTSEEARRRFEYESIVLARLQHPCIAQIYDVGSFRPRDGEPRPYFAMELIDGGVTITTYCREHALELRERVALFLRVVDGVQHGHQRGVIHRDLKPGNLIIDREGNPKIIDFGVARAIGEEADGGGALTVTGQILGTPSYMSPEQFVGGTDVDVRSDVYSLGVVLFELVTGRLPFDVEGKSLVEAAEIVRGQPARRLSSVDTRLRGDLDVIVGTALATDREHRYPSASALAADLRRYLENQPIAARPPSALYQLRMFTRRNRALVAGIVGIVIASLVGAGVSTRFAIVAAHRAEDARRELYRSNLLAAGLALDVGQILAARDNLESAPAELRGWEWRHLSARIEREVAVVPCAEDVAYDVLGVDPQGRRIAVPLPGGIVGLWDVAEQRITARLDSGRTSLGGVDFSADGRRLIVDAHDSLADDLKGGQTRISRTRITQWDIEQGDIGQGDIEQGTLLGAYEPPWVRRGIGRLVDAAGERVTLLVGNAGFVTVELSTGRVVAQREADWAHSLTPIVGDPSGALVAIADEQDRIHVLDGATLATLAVLPEHRGRAMSLAFDETGKHLASASEDALIRVWDVAGVRTGEPDLPRILPGPPRILAGHAGAVMDVAFLPGRGMLASASNDRTIRVWDLAHDGSARILHGHLGWAVGVHGFPDGERLASIGRDATVRIWDLAVLDDPTVLRGHASYANPIALSPDDRMLASGGWEGLLKVPGGVRWWDVASGAQVAAWSAVHIATSLAWSPDGRLLAVGGDRLFCVLDAATGETLFQLDPGYHPGSVGFDASGEHVLYALGGLHVFDTGTFAETARIEGEFSLDDDGPWVVRSRDGEPCELLRTPDLEVVASFDGPAGKSVVERGGRRVAVFGPKLQVFDLERGGDPLVLESTRPFSLAFSPDGERIAVGGTDGVIALFDAHTGLEVARLLGHSAYVYDLEFSRDGERLFSSSGDATVRIWETAHVSDRLQAARRRSALAAEWRPRVEALLGEGLTPHEVLARLEGLAVPAESRAVALQEALRAFQAPR